LVEALASYPGYADSVGRIRAWVARFRANESGASVIEHGLLACIFSLVIVYAVASGLTPLKVYQRIAWMLEADSVDHGSARKPAPRDR
jgi:Flp pilus assembly pilin Flp